jgi:hypothetical protein
MFSDECAIYAGGKNMNSVLWSKENPHFREQVAHHPPTIMVWATMSAANLVGPIFIAGTVTGVSYVNMLRHELLPILQEKGLVYS